jgi:hypothetical protein
VTGSFISGATITVGAGDVVDLAGGFFGDSNNKKPSWQSRSTYEDKGWSRSTCAPVKSTASPKLAYERMRGQRGARFNAEVLLEGAACSRAQREGIARMIRRAGIAAGLPFLIHAHMRRLRLCLGE